MYDDYDLVTPGYKAYNFEELYTKLELFFRNASLLKRSDVDYDLIKVMYNKYSDSKGAERTYQFIKSNL